MQVVDKIRETGEATEEVILTIEATAEEVNATMKAFFAELNERQYEGFRKGKAPRPVLEQSVGGHANAMGGVAEKLINEMAWTAIDTQDVIFMGEPLFNVTSELEEGKPFSMSWHMVLPNPASAWNVALSRTPWFTHSSTYS